MPQISIFFLLASVIYTFIWNALDMPAGVVRFGTESGRLIERCNTEKDCYLEMIKKALPAAIGLPINVQVVAKPFQEELVLRVLCELENLYEKQVQQEKQEMNMIIPKIVVHKANGNSRNGLSSSSAMA